MLHTDLDFATIVSSTPPSSKLVGFVRKSYKANQKYFPDSPERFKVIVCPNEASFKHYGKDYYIPFAKAMVLRNADIVIRSQSFMKATDDRYYRIMAHEMNHTFWVSRAIGREKYVPFWLCEGLACYVAKNRFVFSRGRVLKEIKQAQYDEGVLHHRYLSSHLNSKAMLRLYYSIWCNFTEYLDINSKLKELISLTPTNAKKESFDKLFGDIYGQTKKELFEDFCISPQ